MMQEGYKNDLNRDGWWVVPQWVIQTSESTFKKVIGIDWAIYDMGK